MSSCVASCCTSYPVAFIGSATTACSPTPTAGSTSPPLASFCINPRQRLPLRPAMAVPITAAPDPPSCADTAAPRCSSSRPSHALSTSVALRVHRPHHDQHRINQQNFPAGICFNRVVANALVLVLQSARVLPPQSPLERQVPLRAWHATDSHRSRSPDY